jgi:RimJ/RimL family protein N-acetyltransferase
MLIWDSPNGINEWVSLHGGGFAAPGYCTALGWIDDAGRLVGGIVYHQSNGAHCLANIALANKTFPIGLLKAGLRYAFAQLKLKRLTFIIKSDNIASINLVTALGASLEATLRDADISGNLLIFALFPEDCPIWRKLNGQERKSTAVPGPASNDSPANAGK